MLRDTTVEQQRTALERKRAKERAAIRRGKITERCWVFVIGFLLVSAMLPVAIVVAIILLARGLWRHLVRSLRRWRAATPSATDRRTAAPSHTCAGDRRGGPAGIMEVVLAVQLSACCHGRWGGRGLSSDL